MRWWLMGTLIVVAAIEGVIAANWHMFGVSLPITWLALYFTMANEWVGWRQGLVLAAVSGYVLDVIASPAPGLIQVAALVAWGFGAYVLAKYKFSRDAKVAGLAGGSLILMSSSFVVGPYFPPWLSALIMAAIYLLVSLAAYVVISTVVKFWLARA